MFDPSKASMYEPAQRLNSAAAEGGPLECWVGWHFHSACPCFCLCLTNRKIAPADAAQVKTALDKRSSSELGKAIFLCRIIVRTRNRKNTMAPPAIPDCRSRSPYILVESKNSNPMPDAATTGHSAAKNTTVRSKRKPGATIKPPNV